MSCVLPLLRLRHEKKGSPACKLSRKKGEFLDQNQGDENPPIDATLVTYDIPMKYPFKTWFIHANHVR